MLVYKMYKSKKSSLWKWDMVFKGQIVYDISIDEVHIVLVTFFREESINGKLIVKEY